MDDKELERILDGWRDRDSGLVGGVEFTRRERRPAFREVAETIDTLRARVAELEAAVRLMSQEVSHGRINSAHRTARAALGGGEGASS